MNWPPIKFPRAAIGFFALAGIAYFLLPAVASPRAEAVHSMTQNCLKGQLLGLLNYEARARSLPPAWLASPAGKPLLSWRVLILPYIDEEPLYKEFRLDEPWDSPHNAQLIPKMPEAFASARRRRDAKGKTPYLALRGPQTALRGPAPIRVSQVRDGMTNTAVIVEVLPEYEVIWTRPDDLEIDQTDFAQHLQPSFDGRCLLGFLDGSVHAMRRETSGDLLRAYAAIDDGRVVPFEE